MNIGDIVNLDFTPQAGKEMAFPHYAVVLSAKQFNDLVPLVIVAPITSTYREEFDPLRIDMETIIPSGLHGYICLDHLKSIDPQGRNLKATKHKLSPSCKKQCRDILKLILNL